MLVLFLLLARGLPAPVALGLSLFCGGSISNLIDRAFLGGSVVDFLNLSWGGFRPYIFNVADMAIVSGGILFLLSAAYSSGRYAFGKKISG